LLQSSIEESQNKGLLQWQLKIIVP
jgi:hypothetical protein